MRRSSLYVILALVIVLLLVVVSIFLFFGPKTPEPTPAPQIEPPVEESDTPAPATAAPTPTPEATPEPTPEPTPSPTPAPTPTPEATPEPTPTPTPEPTYAPETSGTLSSDTGTGLNIRVEWKTYTADSGARKLQVDVIALSYSCYTSALWNGVEITVDGKIYSADSPAISYDGTAQLSTLLHSFVIDAPDAASAALTATWHYRGTYSGKELDDISASGTVSLR